MSKENRVWILYDSRACGGETEGASILVACESEKEAKSYRGDFGGMACYSYADNDGRLTDERLEWDWFPA